MTVSCAVKYSYDDLHYEIYRKTKSRGTYGYRTGVSSPNCHMKLGDIRTIDLWLPGPVIGVNAAGVATPPQYLTCMGRPVFTTPPIFWQVFHFVPSAELLNTASRCHFRLQCSQSQCTVFNSTVEQNSLRMTTCLLASLSYNYNPWDTWILKTTHPECTISHHFEMKNS